ncbi:TAT leader-containing periplasmic protein [Shewanella sp. NIFS-20-20]|uniref:TAT leader-containing periplasmic protein n=1 Tax=Shewanella sp. NIFS-20-20 TaxID=2853806 RepID=UPI001C4950ED|nr:TAT leader-containing periplasmic protein [Shewanella sp. NIFS-20-20]MBV7316288.1 TAT leader-containing periplasmic protein [Shewanella sp. NIFS-20-20]
MQRRTFITGVALATVATGIGVSSYLASPDMPNDGRQYDVVWQTFMPMVLEGALPKMPEPRDQAINRTLAAIHGTIAVLPASQQAELDQLLWALNNRLSLLLLTGSITPLMMRTPSELLDVFESWRQGTMDIQMLAYLGLKEVIFSSYYALPEHWSALGYQKPQWFVNPLKES